MEIQKLQHLETLNICDTSVMELPRQIGKLQQLKTLDASNTKVTELPTEIEKLQYLKTLNVCNTKFTKLPREIGKLQQLETLDASNTEITELPTEIENLQYLKTLNVCNTKLTKLPREIGKLQHLETLNVSYTTITELPKEIGKLQHLRTLDISCTKVTELPREITELERLENLIARNSRLRKLPKEIRKLQHFRTLDLRGTHVRELFWEVSKSLSVAVGGMYSVKVLKLPLAVSSHWGFPSSGAKCSKDLSIFVLTNHFNSNYEVQPVVMLNVAGRHVSVPQCVKQHLRNVSSLDIRIYKLGDEDLEFLRQMPNLKALAIRYEAALPREPISITRGGFSKLETFYLDCRLPQVITFQRRAIPNLKHLEFKFYTGSKRQDYSMGIRHLQSLQIVVFRCSQYYTSGSPGITATIEAVRKEAAEHRNRITIYINDNDAEVFGRGAESISQVQKAILEKEIEEKKRIQERNDILEKEIQERKDVAEKHQQLLQAAEKRRAECGDATQAKQATLSLSQLNQQVRDDLYMGLPANPLASLEPAGKSESVWWPPQRWVSEDDDLESD